MPFQELIISYRNFYHVTHASNLDGIRKDGLIPKQIDLLDGNAETIICFTPEFALEKIKEMIVETYGNDIVVLKISGETLSNKNVGYDRTCGYPENFPNYGEVEGFRDYINRYRSVACFEKIPFDELELVPP